MNPIYKFQLSAGNDTRQAFPVYKDDLAIDYALEQNQEFYRGKLSGKLTFQKDDYLFIRNKAFDTQFLLEIFISYNAGQSWTSYWRGTFWKTDCEFNEDDQTAIVTPNVNDRYNAVLAGMDKEYNLIELAPEIVPVKAEKRPMIQVYVPGQSVIGCFLSGMWWEQEAEPESDETKLVNDFKFSLNKVLTIGEISGSMSPQLPDVFYKAFTGDARFTPATPGTTDFVDSVYTLRYYYIVGSGGYTQRWQILRNSDSTVMWEWANTGGGMPVIQNLPMTVTLTPVSGTGATGNVTLYVHDMPVYSRFVCDTPQVSGLNTYPIPADDIVENNRNYTRVIGYYFPDTIYFSTSLTSTPNQWGLYQPGQYYQPPYLYWHPELFPVARNAWGRVSIWFTFYAFDWIVEESGRQPFTIRHTYPISSVISVLLAKIAPGITHAGTTDYSQFLYGQNPLSGIDVRYLITPKSNLVTAGYDQPAQKAPITLKNVLDMLRDCFRCYWFIDEQNRFRVEHIQYFRNGGSYSGSPVVGIDLTTQKVPRNGKEWAFARSQYKFDKPVMAARYQFGWMDDVTQPFEGYPIDIISKYVNPDNIEQIDISKFTSDIDYILLNPGEISKDGFVLLGCVKGTGIISGGEQFTVADGAATKNIFIDTDIPATSRSISYYVSGLSESTQITMVLRKNGSYVDGSIITLSNGSHVKTTIIDFDQIQISWRSGGTAQMRVISVLPPNYSGHNEIPIVEYENGFYLQNAYVAFVYLQRYYAYDMPAYQYEINGEQMYAYGIKKLKNQTLKFPVLNDPDLVQLVKTNLGNGTIEKLSVNLSSRNANATLKYDTE